MMYRVPYTEYPFNIAIPPTGWARYIVPLLWDTLPTTKLRQTNLELCQLIQINLLNF